MELVVYEARVDRLVELRRLRAVQDAEQVRLLDELASDPLPFGCVPNERLDKQWVREEVACALQVAPMTAAAMLAEAGELVTRLPETLALLAAGEIGMRHVRKLVDATRTLPTETAAAIQARVLPRAAQQTPAQFGTSVRRAVLRLDARSVEQRRAWAVADRQLCFTPHGDGHHQPVGAAAGRDRRRPAGRNRHPRRAAQCPRGRADRGSAPRRRPGRAHPRL